jgi:hypothetical protein
MRVSRGCCLNSFAASREYSFFLHESNEVTSGDDCGVINTVCNTYKGGTQESHVKARRTVGNCSVDSKGEIALDTCGDLSLFVKVARCDLDECVAERELDLWKIVVIHIVECGIEVMLSSVIRKRSFLSIGRYRTA